MKSPSRAVTAAMLLAVSILIHAPSAGWGATSPAGIYPQPCFVPAHPLKQRRPPRVEPSRHAPPAPGAIGGGALAYHDTHLHPQGAGEALQPAPRTLKIIAILVDFDDQEMGADLDVSEDPRYTPDAYFTRVLEFLDQMYDTMSNGQLAIDYTLTSQVYRLPEPMSFYGLDDSIATREAELCRDAVEAADADVDFSQYDTYMLFHAGQGQEADINDDSRDQIWSVFFRQIDFRFWLDAPDSENGIRTTDVNSATQEPFYVNHMVVLPESESQDGFDFGILGVVAHEFGHRFGLPDLYDTTAPEDFIFADSQGIGTFGLMGAGIWNQNGFFPAEMCSWSKFYVGWLRPRVLREEQRVVLDAVQLDRQRGAVRVPLGGDEYFLIENRIRDYNGNGEFDFDDADEDGEFDFWDDSYQGAEFDWYLPQEFGGPDPGEPDGSGLLIWHVDESIVREFLLFNLVNAEAVHKGVDLEEADGIQDLDKLEFSFEAFGDPRDSFWAPHATAFTPESTPNTDGYNDANSAVWCTNISAPGTTMTFDLRFTSPDGDRIGDPRPGWPRDLPGLVTDFQPVTGDLDGNGIREIVVGVSDDTGRSGLVVLDADGSSFLNPGSEPEVLRWGAVRSDPILLDMDSPGSDPADELVWVSGDSVLVMKGDGSYVASDGSLSPSPVPYFRLAGSTGRVRVSGSHLEPTGLGLDDRPEIVVGTHSALDPDSSRVVAIAFRSDLGAHARVEIAYEGGAVSHHALANVDLIDRGLREIVSSVRTAAGGYLAVALYDFIENGRFVDVRSLRYSAGDSTGFTAPVVGDLNRDGIEEIVVGDSDGYIHAFDLRISTADGETKITGAPAGPGLFENDKFEELEGWPVFVGTLAEDEVSLADIDDDGFLEVLVFGPTNRLHVLNYNGTTILSLPVAVPGEERFSLVGDDIIPAPYLAPLVMDIVPGGDPELVLPLQDGQVRGHDASGRSLSDWVYLGGGNQLTYPEITDLDGDGRLEMVTVEDITVNIPTDGVIDNGDDADVLERTGRILVRDVGSGSGLGPWPAYRADGGRSGRAAEPAGAPAVVSESLVEAFVMPNPVLGGESARFHYRIPSEVQRVTIEIFSAAGRPVRVLTGTVIPTVDNLVSWDLTNEQGSDVAPGLYFARIQTESGPDVEIQQLKFVVVR